MNVSQSSAQTSHPVSSSSSATAASTASVALTESQRARLVADRLSEAQIDDAADAVTSGSTGTLDSSGDCVNVKVR